MASSRSPIPATDSHRWPRLTPRDEWYGPVCECGNPKTDQALTCSPCAADRRRAPDHWQRRTCPDCGGVKTKDAPRCRPCTNDLQRGKPQATGRPQPEGHPWRKVKIL